VLLLLLACGRPSSTTLPWVPSANDRGPVVARVGEIPIYAADVAAQAAATKKPARAALDELIAFQLLAERHRAAWPPADPAAEQTRREILVQRLLEREFEPKVRLEDLPDAEVRKLYDRAIGTFVHPRLVEVAVLDITFGRKATAEARAAARQAAAAVRAAAVARRARTPDELMFLAGQPEWQAKQVRFFKFLQSHDKPYSAHFGDEVAKLKSAGELSGVIEDDIGVYVALYVSERPAESTPFEKVRGMLRDGYYPRWRQLRFQELIDGLATQHEVEVHPDLLAASGPPGS
jgi:PPIC-type PPIASE domain